MQKSVLSLKLWRIPLYTLTQTNPLKIKFRSDLPTFHESVIIEGRDTYQSVGFIEDYFVKIILRDLAWNRSQKSQPQNYTS